MILLSRGRFKGHVVICDPIYIVSDQLDRSTCPKQEEYVPIDVTPELLRDDQISMIYKYGMEDYYYELEQWEKNAQTDWDRCGYGENLAALGFQNFLIFEPGYRFGSYGVFESKFNMFLGQYCSDSGLVGVFLLDEILAYNEDFDKFNTMPYACGFIPNYNGSIAVVNKNNKKGIEADVVLVGNGNIRFHTRQIGF